MSSGWTSNPFLLTTPQSVLAKMCFADRTFPEGAAMVRDGLYSYKHPLKMGSSHRCWEMGETIYPEIMWLGLHYRFGECPSVQLQHNSLVFCFKVVICKILHFPYSDSETFNQMKSKIKLWSALSSTKQSRTDTREYHPYRQMALC